MKDIPKTWTDPVEKCVIISRIYKNMIDSHPKI